MDLKVITDSAKCGTLADMDYLISDNLPLGKEGLCQNDSVDTLCLGVSVSKRHDMWCIVKS